MNLELLGDHSDSWIICFTDQNYNNVSRVLKRGFRHCFAFTYYPKMKVWMVFEHTSGRTDIRLFTTSQLARHVAVWTETGCKFVKFRSRYNAKLSVRCVMSCVSVIKHLLGLKDCRSLTPYQLFKWLKSNGGQDYIEDIEDESFSPKAGS